MMQTYQYDVEILHLLVSPGHAYFGRARDGAADVPTTDADRVELVAGKGVVGDRFFGKAAHMDAALTLLAVEALEAMAADLGTPPFDPLLTRRNVVLRGAELAPLLGGEFALESQGAFVRPPTPAPGWTGCSPRARTPPCAAGAACAAKCSRTGSCTAGRPYCTALSRSRPNEPGIPSGGDRHGCHSAPRR